MTETQENPLVAKSESPTGFTTNMGSAPKEMDNLNAQTSGAGILNDVASTITDARNGDWLNFGVDVATDGLDLLGAAMDPLGTLASAGVGWLIEHISFLKEGLDQLAGNPEAVTAKATTWENVSKQLEQSAGQYEQAAAKVAPDFQGQGGQAYQDTAKGYAATLRGASGQAHAASIGMNVAAALVGTERGLIRDMISSFVGELIIKGLAALAASWCTFGGTIAAFIADTVVEGGILAEKIGTRIAKVVEQLEKLAKSAGKSKAAIEDAANALKKLGKAADKVTDKSVDLAANIEKKGNELTDSARAAGKSHVDESVGDKAERWKESTAEKVPFHDKLEGAGDKVSEHGRNFLSPEGWQKAGGDVPKPSSADWVGAGTEARRQENEQVDRQREGAEAYKKEHEGEKPEGGEKPQGGGEGKPE
ncbi:WXG100 family type VII secretion target [Amycolatopsis saalfeldensis]|uniref:PPE domain-containing protein n=1 Tax=Amycolatopsis saalfeldensis TaxID=394193 RepID=A0A1H8Y093_9PSEU|nr:hypothetical protein [Amycolatopsis saalfeldensis]SEP45545.1 hypothetical protein SAMN04489732_11062 [Amycolatopsis saalfeldensis]